MQKTEVLITAIEMARSGLGFNPRDAIDCIAELIAEQNPEDDFYAVKVENMLRLCACVWSLRREAVAPAFRSLEPALKSEGNHPEVVRGVCHS